MYLFVGLLSSILAAQPNPSPSGKESKIERIWLSHASPEAGRVVVSWETEREGDSVVEFGPTEALGQEVRKQEAVGLHQVEIAVPTLGPWYYRVRSGDAQSTVIQARGREQDALRVVVIGDIGFTKNPWAAAVLRERPHLLLTAGDNVGQLHFGGKPAAKDDVAAYRKLIDGAPELFRTTPFLPALGNHDREIRPRGPKPPPEPVYDVEATAFRRFFALPGDEWKWRYDVPEFGVRFIAVDLNHVQDLGTTWQTCHDYRADSEQLTWYQKTMSESKQPLVVTIYNEKQSVVRGLAQGAWWPTVTQGSAAITGFGYFAERATVDGFPCFNTSVSGKGDRYPDPKSQFLASEDNYLLLTFAAGGKARAELKNLEGQTLDGVDLEPRQITAAGPK